MNAIRDDRNRFSSPGGTEGPRSPREVRDRLAAMGITLGESLQKAKPQPSSPELTAPVSISVAGREKAEEVVAEWVEELSLSTGFTLFELHIFETDRDLTGFVERDIVLQAAGEDQGR